MRDFLACDETVTLVSHVKGIDTDSYVCYPIQGVSWYEKMKTVVSADGAKPVNSVVVRIPVAALPAILPQKLDFIVKGIVSGVTKPADLKGRVYFEVTAVSDNRRGQLPHVKVAGG